MQDNSEQPHSVLTVASRKRHRNEKPVKTQAVHGVMTARMRRSEGQYISKNKKQSQSKTCPVCGSKLKGMQGVCISCGTILDQLGTNEADTLMPMVPINRLLFVHLDVESGRICYIETNGEHNLTGEFDLKEGGLE